jgi:hypothetical protein
MIKPFKNLSAYNRIDHQSFPLDYAGENMIGRSQRWPQFLTPPFGACDRSQCAPTDGTRASRQRRTN